MCLNSQVQAETPPFRHRSILHVDIAPRHFASSCSEPSTSSASRLFCYIRVPSDTRMATLKQRKGEWLKEHGTKLDWMKHKAESGGRSNPATHNSDRRPLVGRWPFQLINQDFLQSTVLCEFSHMEKTILSRCHLSSIGFCYCCPCLSRKQQSSHLDVPQRHT